jgi:zinc/manganese transport system substrate-binding protein
MFRIFFASALLGFLPLEAAVLKIAVLHPLLEDLARRVGGDRVEVINLIGQNGDPHHFEPKPADLQRAEGASLYLVAGMGLESYLPKLRAIIANKAALVEVGSTLPALEGTCDSPEHDSHHGHTLDPHWWHSIDRFRRASGIVAEALATASPENTATFQKNAQDYRNELDELERWARREFSKIPRDQRHLATAHAAFNYLCKDFGFTPYPVQGMNREQIPDPEKLAALIADLRDHHVAAIFPEKESNPKILMTLTADTGIRLGEPLIADGTGGLTYSQMVKYNVTTIVRALTRPNDSPARD